MDNKTRFIEQTRLMIKVLGDITEDKRLVLHGGTALNLFHFNMARFSTDVDLRWFGDNTMNDFKEQCKNTFRTIQKILSQKGFDVVFKEKHLKLKVRDKWKNTHLNINITVEISKDKINGLMPPSILPLCEKAKNFFGVENLDVLCLNREELFGNKLFTAVLRQTPRDVFDAVLIKENIDYKNPPKQVRKSIIYNIITPGYDKPMLNFFKNNKCHSKEYFDRFFKDMHFTTFPYEKYLIERVNHLKETLSMLNEKDKEFLLSVQNLNPQWDIYDFSKFPAVKNYFKKAELRKKITPSVYNKETKSLEKILYADHLKIDGAGFSY